MTDFNRQVAASTDDGYSFGGTWPGYGTNTYTGNQTRLGASLADFYAAGFRFANVTIPQGATISAAYIAVRCQTAGSFACDLTIWGHDSDNSATFGTTSDPETGAPGYRTLTTASAQWDIGTTAWTLDEWYNSADCASVVQEIVNRGSWASGNAMSLLVYRTSTSLPGADARRYIYQYDYTGNVSGPILYVTYTVQSGFTGIDGPIHKAFFTSAIRGALK